MVAPKAAGGGGGGLLVSYPRVGHLENGVTKNKSHVSGKFKDNLPVKNLL